MKSKNYFLNSKKLIALCFAIFMVANSAFALTIDNSATATAVSLPATIQMGTDLYSAQMAHSKAVVDDTQVDYSSGGDVFFYKVSSASGGDFNVVLSAATANATAQVQVSLYTTAMVLVDAGTTLDTYTNGWTNTVPRTFPLTSLVAGTEYLIKVTHLIAGTNIKGMSVISASLSIDAALSDLQLNGVTITGFNASTYEYTAIYTSATSSVNVTATVNDANAAVAGTGSVTISAGVTSVDLTVTAEAGNTQVYTVSLVIDKPVPAVILMGSDAYSSEGIGDVADAELGSIRYADDNYIEYLVSAASAGSYALLLTHGTGTDPTTLNVDTYAPGTVFTKDVANDFVLTGANVTSYDDETVVHTIPFTLAANTPTLLRITYNASGWCGNSHGMEVIAVAGSTDATLSDLTVGGSTITGFDANTTEYTVLLPVATSSATVGATATDANAQGVTGTGSVSVSDGATSVDITVTAEAGNAQIYTVNLVVAKAVPSSFLIASEAYDYLHQNTGNANKRTDAAIEYTTVGDWHEYAITSAAGGDFALNVTAASPNAGAEVRIDYYNLTDGETIADAVVGTSTDVNTGDWNSPTTVVTESVTLDAGDTYVMRATLLGAGCNLFAVSVVSTTGSTDATLSDLTVGGSTIAGFDANTFAYTVFLPVGSSSATVGATATDANAQGVSGTGSVSVAEGRTEAAVTCTSEAGTTQDYTIKFINPIAISAAGKSLAMLDDLVSVPATKSPSVTNTVINWWSAGEYIEYCVYSAESQNVVLLMDAANADNSGVSSLNASTYDIGAEGSWVIDEANTEVIPWNGSDPADWDLDTQTYFSFDLVANTPQILRLQCVSNSNGNSLANVHNFTLTYNYPTGVENSEVNKLSTYPNPANGQFFVNGLEQGSNITLINTAGKVVLQQSISNVHAPINVSHLKNGMYILKSGSTVEKLIIQN